MLRRKTIKGLANFISDIRAAPSFEAEKQRVEKELAKIRQRFSGKQRISGYERKKGVWKLVYCYMLGHDVNLGQIEAINLVSSQVYSEKVTGYIACSLLLSGKTDILSLLINLVKRDLQSRLYPTASLALNFLANAANDETIDMLYNDVAQLTLPHVSVPLQSKAYLVLLRFARQRPDLFATVDSWVTKVVQAFQRVTESTCLMALVSFTLGLLELCPRHSLPQDLLNPALSLLWRIVFNQNPDVALYNGIPDPWLQIKLLRILQFYSAIPQSPETLEKISNIMRKLLSRSPALPVPVAVSCRVKRRSKALQERQSHANVEHAIFFEAVNVLLEYDTLLDDSLRCGATATLSIIDAVRDCNIRCLRLEVLSRLAVNMDTVRSLCPQIKQILTQIYEPDDSLRRQAVNLLFVICTKDTWQPIVDELLGCLRKSPDAQFREELVLKIATLVEKHAPNLTWYIDTVFSMIECCPDAVCDEVWHRLIHMILGTDRVEESLQIYAAQKAYDKLSDYSGNETLVKLASYLLGEFGHLIIDDVSGRQQFTSLRRHLHLVENDTKAILLTALVKLSNTQEDVEQEIYDIFEKYSTSADVDLQQRAVEFLALCQLDNALLEDVLACMPSYPQEKLEESPLVERLRNYNQKRAVPRVLLENAATSKGLLLKNSVLSDLAHNDRVSSDGDAASDGSSTPGTPGPALRPRATTTTSSDLSSSSAYKTENSTRTSQCSSPTSPNASSYRDRQSFSIPANEHDSTHHAFSSPGFTQSIFPLPELTDASALWSRLCLLPEGLLISSYPIHVMVKQQYKNGMGRFLAMWVNDASETIELQRIVVESFDELPIRTVFDPITENLKVLSPKGMAKHALQMSLLEPFPVSPQYTCYGAFKETHKPFVIRTALPVRLTSFMSSAPLHTERLMSLWETFSTVPQGQDAELKGHLIPALTGSISLLQTCLVDGFHFYVHQTNSVLYCSGTLSFCPRTQAEPTRHIPCLMRVVTMLPESSEVQFAIRTPQAIITRVLLDTVASYVIGAPVAAVHSGALQRHSMNHFDMTQPKGKPYYPLAADYPLPRVENI